MGSIVSTQSTESIGSTGEGKDLLAQFLVYTLEVKQGGSGDLTLCRYRNRWPDNPPPVALFIRGDACRMDTLILMSALFALHQENPNALNVEGAGPGRHGACPHLPFFVYQEEFHEGQNGQPGGMQYYDVHGDPMTYSEWSANALLRCPLNCGHSRGNIRLERSGIGPL